MACGNQPNIRIALRYNSRTNTPAILLHCHEKQLTACATKFWHGTGSRGSQLLHVLAQLVRLLRQVDTPDNPSPVALAVLRRLTHGGAGRVTDLARAEPASQPGMTQLIARLERAGLVRRVPDLHDRRSVLVKVTAAGRDLLTRTETHHAATLDALLNRLNSDDRETIMGALPALGRLAQVAEQSDLPTESNGPTPA